AVELLRRQEALQVEAQRLIGHLDLFRVLAHTGKPEQIGSSVSGLMVWRDLDFNVLCSHRSLHRVFETMQALLTNPQVIKLPTPMRVETILLPNSRGMSDITL
ncbi:MAG TPA: hypothetical protein VKU38_04570, partial [Ktedonobacteraceae bacterium]|nr:hypothetical protein [Ktedonobacteraceae bacterium]